MAREAGGKTSGGTPLAKKGSAGKAAAKPGSDSPSRRGGANNALNQKVGYSDELAEIVGKPPMARSEITSKLWDYIRKKDLQAKDDRRQIEPDAPLAKVIGKDRISMFKMTAAVNKHIEKG